MKRKLNDEQLKLWFYNAVRSVLILEKGLLPDEADAVLAASGLESNLEQYPEATMHDDPRDIAMSMKRFYPII